MWGHLGDPLSPLAPVSYRVHLVNQLLLQLPQSLRKSFINT